MAALLLGAFAPLAVATTYTWTTGDFVVGSGAGATAPSPLLPGDTLVIDFGGVKRFVGVTFANEGTVLWQGDAVQGGNSADIFNKGLWDSRSDTNVLTFNFGGRPTFTNTGTLRKSVGAGATTIGDWAFVNDGGTLDAQIGTIVFSGGSTSFNADSRFQGAGIVSVTGGASFTGAFRSDNLLLSSGTFTGASAVFEAGVASTSGLVTWTGGDFTGTWTVNDSGNVLLASGSASKRQVGGSITNGGTVRWNTSAAFQGGNSGVLTNNGLFEAQMSAAVTHDFGGQNTFTNNATGIVRAANGSTLTFGGLSLVSNGGEFNAQSGSAIDYAGGSARFNDGTRFTGAGTHTVSSNARFVGSFQTGNVSFTAGTQTGGDGVTPGSKAVLGAALAWVAGDLQGIWEIPAGSTLTASGAGAKRQVGGAIVNAGIVLWNSAAAFQGGNSGAFTNNGLFEAQMSSAVTHNFGGQNTFTNSPSGIVRASNDSTLTFGGLSLVSNGAEFNAQAGSAIDYAGGSARFNDGTRFTGAGAHTVSNSARFVGSFQSGNLFFTAGAQSGGDGVTPDSKAVLGGTLTWVAGDLQGAWEITAGSTLTASGDGTKRQVGGSIANAGTMLWNTNAAFQGGNSGTFRNDGLFEAPMSSAVTHNFGGQSTFTNSPAGIVRASNDSTLTFGGLALVSTGGEFNAQAGSAIDYAGGFARFNDGTRFTGGGTHAVSSNARFVGAFQTGNVFFTGGAQTGGDGTAGSKAVLQGPLTWTAGDLQGSWQIAAGSTLTATDAGNKRQVGGSVVNDGTFRWSSVTPFQGGNSGSFTNNGLVDIVTDAAFTHSFGGQNSFVNAGLLTKSAGSGETSLAEIALTNPGTIDVRAGTLRLPANFSNAGTLTGTAAFAVSGTLTNTGHVAPGASPGTLTIEGNFAQTAAGTFDAELTSSTLHDLLLVNGTASLDGTLALHCFADCRMAVGETIVILDATGALTGAFSAVTSSGFATGSFGPPIYDRIDNRVLLTVLDPTAPIPEPETYALMLTGLGFVACVVARRRRGMATRP